MPARGTSCTVERSGSGDRRENFWPSIALRAAGLLCIRQHWRGSEGKVSSLPETITTARPQPIRTMEAKLAGLIFPANGDCWNDNDLLV